MNPITIRVTRFTQNGERKADTTVEITFDAHSMSAATIGPKIARQIMDQVLEADAATGALDGADTK
jgi:hypothetical protein